MSSGSGSLQLQYAMYEVAGCRNFRDCFGPECSEMHEASRLLDLGIFFSPSRLHALGSVWCVLTLKLLRCCKRMLLLLAKKASSAPFSSLATVGQDLL